MIEKQKGPSIEYPPKPNEPKRFIVQSHARGRSNHWDFRFALNDVAEGWTVNANVEGAIEIPIVTLAQLKALHEDQKAWKVDLETGKILPRKVRTTIRGKTRIVVRPGNLFATPKAAVIPKEWMDVEGRTPFPPDWPKTLLEWWDKWPSYVRAELRKAGWDPERARAILDGKEKWKVKEVPVGATRAFPGVFYKFEDGFITLGSRRPWFFEYHVEEGKFFQGRLCFRLVTREKAEKSTAWQELVASRFFIVDGPGGAKIVKQVLPPAEAEEEAKLPGFWMFQTPDPPGEIHPYVLSEEAIEKKWLPPRPASALPQKFQKEVPKELRFWTIEDREKALEAREKLAEFFESGAKKSFPVVKLRKGEFKLVAQHWRGPVIIRWPVSRRTWTCGGNFGRRRSAGTWNPGPTSTPQRTRLPGSSLGTKDRSRSWSRRRGSSSSSWGERNSRAFGS